LGGVSGTSAVGVPRGAPGVRVVRTLTAARYGPAGVVLRVAAMAAAALGATWIRRVNDPGVLGPLRAFTGISCALRGGTTVLAEPGSGRPALVGLANPVAFTGVVASVIASPRDGDRWWALRPGTRTRVAGTALLGSGLWQRVRLGLLRV